MRDCPQEYHLKQIEEWRLCQDLDNLYEVSNAGRIRSLDRTVHYKDGRIRHYNGVVITPVDKGNGYFVVNIRGKLWYIHRLVANAFVPNPYKLNEVNHKDENPSNNNADNLEWCTHRYNCSYGTSRRRMALKRHINRTFGEKEVLMFSKNGDLIRCFRSTRAAMNETGIASSSISYCCRGIRKTAGGYVWIYKSDYDNRESEQP